MDTSRTDFYHAALDLLPERVITLAQFLRDLSRSMYPVVSDLVELAPGLSYEKALDAVEIQHGHPEDINWVTYHDEYRLNWFRLARDCHVDGMPTWQWRAIVDQVRQTYRAIPDPDAGEECAYLLLRLCYDFVGVPPRVAKLAAFLRELSLSPCPEIVNDEAAQGPVYALYYEETSVRRRPPGNSSQPVDCRHRHYLNWAYLARTETVDGMSAAQWREIVAEVSALWSSKPLSGSNASLAASPGGTEPNTERGEQRPTAPEAGESWDPQARGAACAELLLRRCSDFALRLNGGRGVRRLPAPELKAGHWRIVMLCSRDPALTQAAIATKMAKGERTVTRYVADLRAAVAHAGQPAPADMADIVAAFLALGWFDSQYAHRALAWLGFRGDG